MIFKLLFLSLLTLTNTKNANVLMTEVFAIPLDPLMFNWTFEGYQNQFVYQASLFDYPDLPSWINYVFSHRHHHGFLYGVSPTNHKSIVPIEVIALNKRTYETRTEIVNIIISEKLNQARFELHMKIDNLNVEDMFDVERMNALKDIFRKQLWKDSDSDLYVTLLNSATEMGARKPLNPNEGEGVVIRLGSEFVFSNELIELQEEVKPLWKVPSCPREFKRTSVERIFRDAGFLLDWCSFKLIDRNSSLIHHSERNEYFSLNDEHPLNRNDHWQSIKKSEVPERQYFNELLLSFLLPMFILVVLVLLLSFLLCFHHDAIDDEESEDHFKNLFHICTDFYYDYYIYKKNYSGTYIGELQSDDKNHIDTYNKTTDSLHNYSGNRDVRMSPDLHSHTNSPNSTMGHGMHCRPSPPPYVRPKYKPDL